MKKQYYDPENIFSKDTDMTGQNNIDLAKAFVKTRYQYNPLARKLLFPQGDINNFNNFKNNAAAVKIFDNTNNNEPIITNALSQKIIGDNTGSSYGHSEPRALDQGLADLIKQHYNNNKEALSLRNYKSKYPNEIEKFQQLHNNAKQYQKLLNQNKHIVQLWSERQPCINNNNYNVPGCSNLLNDILPKDSQVGYITEVPKYTKSDDIAKLNQKASLKLGDAYLNYKNQHQQQTNQPTVQQYQPNSFQTQQFQRSGYPQQHQGYNQQQQGFNNPFQKPFQHHYNLPQQQELFNKQSPLNRISESPNKKMDIESDSSSNNWLIKAIQEKKQKPEVRFSYSNSNSPNSNSQERLLEEPMDIESRGSPYRKNKINITYESPNNNFGQKQQEGSPYSERYSEWNQQPWERKSLFNNSSESNSNSSSFWHTSNSQQLPQRFNNQQQNNLFDDSNQYYTQQPWNNPNYNQSNYSQQSPQRFNNQSQPDQRRFYAKGGRVLSTLNEKMQNKQAIIKRGFKIATSAPKEMNRLLDISEKGTSKQFNNYLLNLGMKNNRPKNMLDKLLAELE